MPELRELTPSLIASKDKRAVVIVNLRSRRGKDWLHPVREALSKTDLDVIGFHAVRNSDTFGSLLRSAVKEGVPLVIVGGGDGSLSEAAGAMRKSKSTLGVLPMGTGNAFARDLGIVPNVDEACKIISEGYSALVDLGLANADVFVNVATAGLSTRIAEQLTREAKHRLGKMVYLYALLRAMTLVKPFRAKLTTPEGEESFRTLQVVIGNGRCHAGPLLLSPTASIVDGKLEVYALASTSRAAFVKMALHARGGHHVDLPEVRFHSVSEGHLETVPPRRITVDGELASRSPLKFKSLPHALRVMVPKDFKG